LSNKAIYSGKYSIIPSGVNMEIFFPVDKKYAREQLGLPIPDKLVLFSGSFCNKVKNFPLADSAVKLLPGVRFLELEGYNRHQVNLMLNACDTALLTSFHEGSPQFIKEALACNRPIVSTDVGDVKTLIGSIDGCFIIKANKWDISEKLKLAMEFESTLNGRQRIIELGLELETITKKIIDIYKKVSKN
jgi:glycosyltransferase involved in cell wall biosynthesis